MPQPDGPGSGPFSGGSSRGGWTGSADTERAAMRVAPPDRAATPPEDGWAEEAGVRIAEELTEVIRKRGTATLALAGGTTPRSVYAWLARAGGVPWNRVDIYFGDERCVPPDHPASNYRMVRESLLDPAGIDPVRVHRMRGETRDPAAAAEAYEALLPEELDVLLLGVGGDGHVASLFPRNPALHERYRSVTDVTAPTPPARRLTITPRVLDRAGRLLILARGEAKAEAVVRALEGDWSPDDCPAQLARRGTWLLDAAAASGLSAGGSSTGWGGRPPG